MEEQTLFLSGINNGMQPKVPNLQIDKNARSWQSTKRCRYKIKSIPISNQRQCRGLTTKENTAVVQKRPAATRASSER